MYLLLLELTTRPTFLSDGRFHALSTEKHVFIILPSQYSPINLTIIGARNRSVNCRDNRGHRQTDKWLKTRILFSEGSETHIENLFRS